MSHFSEIKTEFRDAEALVEALVAVGVQRDWIELHKTPQPLIDYKGNRTYYRWKETRDARFKDGDCGTVIIRRKNLPWGHNDIGFLTDQKNSFALICDFARDQSGYNDKWLGRVKQEYAIAVARKHYARQGKTVQRVDDAGKVRLYVRAG